MLTNFGNLYQKSTINVTFLMLIVTFTKLGDQSSTLNYIFHARNICTIFHTEHFAQKMLLTLITCNFLTNRPFDFKSVGLYNSAFYVSIEKELNVNKIIVVTMTSRSSHAEVFLGKGVLKICSKF